MEDAPQKRRPVTQIFAQLMDQNPNIADVKAMIKVYTDRTEGLTYQALIGTEEQYLQAYGLTYHEEEHFNYINQMLHERTNIFLDKIQQSKVQVRSTLPPPPPPPAEVPPQIVSQVDSILNNLDLPLSLFKRNDNYWSPDNAKTLQVKQYIKKLHEDDRKWKGELKKKRQEILNQKNEIYHKNNEEAVKQQQKMKEEEKNRMVKKIQIIKSQSESRKKTIEESLEFMKKQGRPLFKKMEEDFVNKVELPTLEEKKRKLSEIRSLRKSVDLIEIQQHREKYEKIKEQHDPVKIHNQAVKVSFKGSFHQSLQKSRMGDIESQSRLKTLLDRKEYSRIVQQKHKPAIDQEKANQIAERIEMMSKKFTRAKKKNRRMEDDEDGDQQEEQQEPEPEPEPQQEQQEEDDEDQDGVKPPKDDQYQPSQEERYKMGLKFLQEARRRRKKVTTARNQSSALVDQSERNKTFSAQQAKQSQVVSNEFQTITPSLITNQSGGKIRYRNYLHEMSKANKTIDHIDTSRIKKEFTQDMRLKQPLKMEEIENKIRTVEEKAKQEEALLKHGRKKKSQALEKKQELDNVILDTIKARLALMKN